MKTVKRLVLGICTSKGTQKKRAVNEGKRLNLHSLCVLTKFTTKCATLNSNSFRCIVQNVLRIHSENSRSVAFFFSPPDTANSMDISIESNKVQLIAILFRHSRTKFITNATHFVYALIPSARNNATLRSQSSVEYSFIYI